MSLANRLRTIEARLAGLEDWRSNIEASIREEEAADGETPPVDLDGIECGSDRDEYQPL